MDVEKDYVTRLVKETVRLIGRIIFGKKRVEEVYSEIHGTSAEELYDKLIKLSDEGYINEAENLLFVLLDRNNINDLQIALAFYEHINDYTTPFLHEHNYTRDEIVEGLQTIAKEYGVSEMVLGLLAH